MFKLGKSRDDKTRITTVIFPQPALPAAEYEHGPGKTKRMMIQNYVGAANMARIQTTANSPNISSVRISATDVIGMKSIVRDPEDKLFDYSSIHFTGNLRVGNNPLYARPTCHLKLSQNVNWFDESRSTMDQHLTA